MEITENKAKTLVFKKNELIGEEKSQNNEIEGKFEFGQSIEPQDQP